MKTEKYILIDGPSQEIVKLATQQLSDLYSDSGYTDGITIYTSSTKQNLHLLNFENEPDFERFKHFVNYLAYPEINNYKAKVLGYSTIANEDKLPKQHLNQRALLYVSDHDTEGDNVYAIFPNSDKTIKLGFAVGEEYKVLEGKKFDFAEPQLEKQEFEPIGKITPNLKSDNKTGKGCSLAMATFLSVGTLLVWMIS